VPDVADIQNVERTWQKMNILAIDPGNEYSAFVVMDEQYRPLDFGKIENPSVFEAIADFDYNVTGKTALVVIEMISSYGMAVGKEVFETVYFIGRFEEYALTRGLQAERIYRKDVKLNICQSARAKDGNIIQALKDRFGDKGTKKNPGWFYGFKADCWQAYALGVTYLDQHKSAYPPATTDAQDKALERMGTK
jgi:hypothetical protein